MGGSHGHSTGGVTTQAHPRAHTVMLALLAPILLATVVGVVLLWPSPGAAEEALASLPATGAELQEGGVVRATAEGVCEGGTPEDRLPDGSIPETVPCAFAQVELTSGPDAGEIVEISIPYQSFQTGVADGTRLVLVRFPPVKQPEAESAAAPNAGPSGSRYAFEDFSRSSALWLLAIAFAVLVVAVGRLRGLAAVVGLVLTFATIALFLLPALRAGSNAVLVAVCSAVVIMTVVLYLAHGFSARTTAALLGTVFGLLFSAGLAVWATDATRLGGVSDEETFTLSLLIGQSDLSGILLAGIVIAVLGVLNDVTITQVSAVWEVHGHAPELRFGALFRTGMRIGRDHLASTVYTIAFAYAGAALPSLILIDIYGQPLGQVLTSTAVAEEIVRTMVGSIGLVLAIPATTAIAAAAVAPPWLRALRDARPAASGSEDAREHGEESVHRARVTRAPGGGPAGQGGVRAGNGRPVARPGVPPVAGSAGPGVRAPGSAARPGAPPAGSAGPGVRAPGSAVRPGAPPTGSAARPGVPPPAGSAARPGVPPAAPSVRPGVASAGSPDSVAGPGSPATSSSDAAAGSGSSESSPRTRPRGRRRAPEQ